MKQLRNNFALFYFSFISLSPIVGLSSVNILFIALRFKFLAKLFPTLLFFPHCAPREVPHGFENNNVGEAQEVKLAEKTEAKAISRNFAVIASRMG